VFYLAIRAVHDVVCPWFKFLAVILVKRLIVGMVLGFEHSFAASSAIVIPDVAEVEAQRYV
jgi:hypothetical protein